jgi:pimeloyl-ACP methyl ester carboxylesterase
MLDNSLIPSQVPLDYDNPDNGEQATIAIVRIPAEVSQDDPTYRGPILFNPGGPGVSGVGYVLNNGLNLTQEFGPTFDYVGFDPRGTGSTTPSMSWYASEAERAGGYFPGNQDLAASEDSVKYALAQSRLNADLAKVRAGDVLPYMHTEFVVEDMIRIIEAHGREKIIYQGIS